MTEMTQIKNRFTGAVLHEGTGTLQEEMRKAIASRADLSRANLSRANLSAADLSWADLSRADLSWANLMCLPIGDPRGYRPVAMWCNEWIVFAGCRRFTLAEARAHWGANYKGVRSTGDQYLAAMDWLENQPKPEDGK